MSAVNEKAWGRANTTRPQTETNGEKFNAPAANSASGFNRELLPEPVAYYEAQGLTLQGPRSAKWRTAECRFHSGSDSMRIKVTTGAFVCMACGARGGDVLAYHMAAHGIGFIEAAKRLGAWIGNAAPQRHIRPTTLSARDAISALADEATLIGIEGSRMAKGIKPSPEDWTRLLLAVGRFNHVRGLFA
jgi:hypothetical protein